MQISVFASWERVLVARLNVGLVAASLHRTRYEFLESARVAPEWAGFPGLPRFASRWTLARPETVRQTALSNRPHTMLSLSREARTWNRFVSHVLLHRRFCFSVLCKLPHNIPFFNG